jgi:ribosomal protein L29
MWLCALVAPCLITGCGRSDQTKKELADVKAQLAREQSRAPQELAAARDKIKKEQNAARDKLSAERNKYADLKTKEADLQSRLDDLRKQLGQTRTAIAKGTIDGTGTFVVGQDIEPGTYRAAASPGCYWARLKSLDTSNIIDNQNADGPVVVEILPSDKAFETDGCAKFHKTG